MKKAIFLVFILIILASLATAIDVSLVTPIKNAQLQYEINNIQFTCQAPNAEVLKLYTNINGSWAQSGNTVYGSKIPESGKVMFTIVGVKEGTYSWNCLANEINWAPSNFTFNFQFPPNEPPVCLGNFNPITLEKNTPQIGALNLNNHFTDPENDLLTFDFSGNNNIDITVKSSGLIDLSPKQNRIATDSIYFRTSDGKNSDVPCTTALIVTIEDSSPSQDQNNKAPEITPEIPDQTKEETTSYWEIDLDDYVNDDNSNSELTWTVENVGDDVVNISINNINHNIKFTPIGVGSDNINIKVTDPSGLTDEQAMKITITSEDTTQDDDSNDDSNLDDSNLDDGEDGEDDDFEEFEEEIKIESHTPGSSDPLLEEGQSLEFSIKANKANFDVIWFVDGVQVDEGSNIFKFEAHEEGDFKILALVSKSGNDDSYEWDLRVIGVIDETIALEAPENLCGNGEINENENCSTCPEDIVCGEGTECIESECKEPQRNQITGFAIGDIKNMSAGGKIGVFIVTLVVILFLLILVIRTKNLRKSRSKDRKLTSFEPKIKESKHKEDHILTKIEKEAKNPPPPSMEHIIGFIQSGLASGDTEKTIKKSLANGGWNRSQIKQAFKGIKKQ